MNTGRLLAAIAGAFVGASWFMSADTSTSAYVGAATFTALGATFLPVGLWRNFWAEIMAALGVGVMVAYAPGMMFGALLIMPALTLLVVRAWRGMQDGVTHAAARGKQP